MFLRQYHLSHFCLSLLIGIFYFLWQGDGALKVSERK